MPDEAGAACSTAAREKARPSRKGGVAGLAQRGPAHPAEGIAHRDTGPAGVEAHRPSREFFPAPAQIVSPQRPSRDLPRAGPGGLQTRRSAGLVGESRSGPAGMAWRRPSRDSPATGPGETGRDWPRNLICRPEKAEFAVCRPTNVNSGQEKLYAGRESYMPAGRAICRPGECRSRPRTHICRLGQKYASRDINMPARGSRLLARRCRCRSGTAICRPG
jgi:hypothetical protein